jgi:hypothetical protein
MTLKFLVANLRPSYLRVPNILSNNNLNPKVRSPTGQGKLLGDTEKRITILRLSKYLPLAIIGSLLPLSLVTESATPKPPFSCSDEGTATTDDKAELNKLKNRVSQANNPVQMTSAQINALPTTEPKVNELQKKAVFVEGFLIDVKQQGKETTNCGETGKNADYHLWLVDTADQVDLTDKDTIRASKGKSTVIEITPRWRSVNPGWNLKTIGKAD